MGTLYNIKISHTNLKKKKLRQIRKDVDTLLKTVNKRMSSYDPKSELSLFNTSTQTSPFNVSTELVYVTKLALKLSQQTHGAFDPTVSPLVNLWGFGKDGSVTNIPDQNKIDIALKEVGYKHMSIPSPTELQKDDKNVSIDLASIAKGYGVDEVANFLTKSGCSNVLVEIGGEIVTTGKNDSGEPWQIQIETPNFGEGIGEGKYMVLSLSNKAIATSGDYRNYFKDKNQTYSHIIEPKTGWPVTNNVASVSVIAPNCMTADALATALTVLGPKEGITLLKQYPNTEALFIIRNKNGTYTNAMSDGFKQYISNQ